MKSRTEADKKAAMNKLADEFETGVKGIVQTVSSASTQMQATAKSMSATAEETNRLGQTIGRVNEIAAPDQKASEEFLDHRDSHWEDSDVRRYSLLI
ncbi:MAG TPA: hypothetical protein VGB82_08940 [Alphaproteobacteria bacterium]